MGFIVRRTTKDNDNIVIKVNNLKGACKVIQNDAFMNFPEDAEVYDWEHILTDVIDMFITNDKFEMKLIKVTYKIEIDEN